MIRSLSWSVAVVLALTVVGIVVLVALGRGVPDVLSALALVLAGGAAGGTLPPSRG